MRHKQRGNSIANRHI